MVSYCTRSLDPFSPQRPWVSDNQSYQIPFHTADPVISPSLLPNRHSGWFVRQVGCGSKIRMSHPGLFSCLCVSIFRPSHSSMTCIDAHGLPWRYNPQTERFFFFPPCVITLDRHSFPERQILSAVRRGEMLWASSALVWCPDITPHPPTHPPPPTGSAWWHSTCPSEWGARLDQPLLRWRGDVGLADLSNWWADSPLTNDPNNLGSLHLL